MDTYKCGSFKEMLSVFAGISTESHAALLLFRKSRKLFLLFSFSFTFLWGIRIQFHPVHPSPASMDIILFILNLFLLTLLSSGYYTFLYAV